MSTFSIVVLVVAAILNCCCMGMMARPYKGESSGQAFRVLWLVPVVVISGIALLAMLADHWYQSRFQ